MSEALQIFDPALVIARIAGQVPALREIGGAAESSAAYERPGAVPAAYVIVAAEHQDDSQFSQLGEIITRVELDVLIVVRNYRAAERGLAHTEAIRPVVGSIRAALNGWRPTMPAGVRAETMRSNGRCQVIRFDQAHLWWLDKYGIAYRSRIT
jgi:hypothetical protein